MSTNQTMMHHFTGKDTNDQYQVLIFKEQTRVTIRLSVPGCPMGFGQYCGKNRTVEFFKDTCFSEKCFEATWNVTDIVTLNSLIYTSNGKSVTLRRFIGKPQLVIRLDGFHTYDNLNHYLENSDLCFVYDVQISNVNNADITIENTVLTDQLLGIAVDHNYIQVSYRNHDNEHSFFLTCVHEVGHSLGLRHSFKDGQNNTHGDSIMDYSENIQKFSTAEIMELFLRRIDPRQGPIRPPCYFNKNFCVSDTACRPGNCKNGPYTGAHEINNLLSNGRRCSFNENGYRTEKVQRF